MSPLTYWHYLFISALSLIFILGVILAFRSDSKWSIITTIIVILALIGVFGWITINNSVYRVEVLHYNHHRNYQTEQIVITGVVKNIGDFPVSNVIGTVKIVNTRGGNDRKASQFRQPTAFAEILGDDPNFKAQNITSDHLIANSLSPKASKTFTIIMDYPPYFGNGAYEIEASAN